MLFLLDREVNSVSFIVQHFLLQVGIRNFESELKLLTPHPTLFLRENKKFHGQQEFVGSSFKLHPEY